MDNCAYGGYCGHRGVNEPIPETIEVMKTVFLGGGRFAFMSGSTGATRTEGTPDGAEGVKLHFPDGRGRLASAPSLQSERRWENNPRRASPVAASCNCRVAAPVICSPKSHAQPLQLLSAGTMKTCHSSFNPGALIQKMPIRTF